MEKLEFKNKVLNWLKENDIEFKKKMRIYNYRGNWELRIYNEPMEIPNGRKSFRENKEKTREMNDGKRHGSLGIHRRLVSTYIHINETDFGNEQEKQFILQMLKDNL